MDNSGTEPQEENGLDSLEGSNTVVEPSSGESQNNDVHEAPSAAEGPVSEPAAGSPADTSTNTQAAGSSQPPQPKSPKHNLGRLFRHLNIYLVLFLVLLAIGIAVVVLAVMRSRSNTPTLSTQTLSQSALNQLASTDVSVGSVKQVLNVQSNAIFAGSVLARGDLQVAGKLQTGKGLSVSGGSTFDQLQVNKSLAVLGNQSIQGGLTIQKSLTVNGDGTFQGNLSANQITASSLQLNSDLALTHHITAGGPTPSRSNGNALGSGGSASLSGSDTSGSITINTGINPAAGCFLTVTFSKAFNATPHVLITPIGSSSAGIKYYVTRNTGSFSVCTTSAAPASASFGFDYWVAD